VRPRCPVARPGGCGGCDFQHVALPAQRRLLGEVVAEQLRRLARVEVDVDVEPVAGDADGLDWRTRVRFATDEQGRAGLRRHRSHDVVPLDDCPIAHPGLPDVLHERWPGSATVEVVVSGHGEGQVAVDGDRVRGRAHVTESAVGRSWRVSGGGFWQVHPGAADALTGAVLEMLAPRAGETAVDMYSGVGLFAGALGERVGDTGRVHAVESHAGAVRDARRNLYDLPQVVLHIGRVDAVLAGLDVSGADVVLLDPPRVGARRQVVDKVAALRPRAVCYVACDPAALARDVATFGERGYHLTRLRAFDIFPMTHHVECVALLTPKE
ncbi:MAG: class I SAM-dependent RNA methyltransferase, partial [Actinomycetota bacterium]|nr:class I SAM-dependent RNA methyltransferase [Actinomycetota bacterium]